MIRLTPKRLKILKTFNFYLCFIALGMLMAIPGPTLLDLQHLVGTDTKSIAFIFTARSIGYLTGALAGGVVFDYTKSKLALLTGGSILATIATFCVPWSTSLKMLIGLMVLIGLSLGALDTGCNVYFLNMWGDERRSLYLALHFMFGVGGLIGPLIAAPFLGNYSSIADDPAHHTNRSEVEVSSPSYFYSSSTDLTLDEIVTNVNSIYSIIGGISLLASIIFITVTLLSRSQTINFQETSKEQFQKRSCVFMCVIISLFSLLIFVETGTEIGYPQMLTSFAVKGKLQLSPATGSYMTSAFWAAFTVGRLVSIFLAIKLSSFTLLITDIAIASAGALVFLIFSDQEWALWVTSILLGFGISSFYPSAVSWLNKYINVTNKIISLFVLGYSAGDMTIPFTISRFIDDVPEVLSYVVVTSCISIAILASILFIILRKEKLKNKIVENIALQ
ncbi:sodium-dependent glucose transporter 1A-like [Uloborus diversus]|uniref:sodium-dependent glucose transporter 1A-like n=1 Tax=Uloborus diversus TaxID=327109 RepID=UPI0024097C1A|nr:sodium-dependent glucose transporter 1A-like [Uloborus diversus]